MIDDYEALVDSAIREIGQTGTIPVSADAVGVGNSRLIDGASFLFDEPDEIPAVWGSGDQVLWAEGEGLMIAGQQGLGKTTLGQQLGLHRIGVRDGPFLGLPVALSNRPVLYLAMDRPRQAARSMRRMVSADDRDVLKSSVQFWKGPIPVTLSESTSEFADWVQRAVPGVGLVVVDSVKDLATGISDDKVGAALNSAWQELIARGVELLLLHHERKAGQNSAREPRLDNVYGSTWLTSGLGSVIGLHGEPGDSSITLHHLKQPMEPVGPLSVRHDHAVGRSSSDDGPRDVKQVLIDHGHDSDGLTMHDLALLIYGRSGSAEIKRISRELKRIEDSVEVVKGVNTGGGRQPHRYRIVPFVAANQPDWEQ